MVTIRQIPTDTSLTASTNVISMPYPNTILNTKMTLPQLVGPIDVVSPEHSSGDRSHEFQIASSKNASIEFSKAEYARPTKAELAHCTTSSPSSKYAQSQKLSSLTSQKYRIFPQLLHICLWWIINNLLWVPQYDTVYVFVDNRTLSDTNAPAYWQHFAPWIGRVSCGGPGWLQGGGFHSLRPP